MRIVSQLGQSHFYHNPKEVQPLKDIFDIFSGQYVCTKTIFGLDQFTYRTKDSRITGASTPLGGFDASVTELQVKDLELSEQAARWTALEVYKHVYYQKYESESSARGFQRRQLMVVAPDQRFLREWDDRKDPSFMVRPVFDGHDLSNDTEVSLLQARGDTLLSAAQTMVKYYGELSASADLDASLSELDASMTIAQVLGSTSIEHFEEMWNQAITQPDPKAAAQYAYRSLTA